MSKYAQFRILNGNELLFLCVVIQSHNSVIDPNDSTLGFLCQIDICRLSISRRQKIIVFRIPKQPHICIYIFPSNAHFLIIRPSVVLKLKIFLELSSESLLMVTLRSVRFQSSVFQSKMYTFPLNISVAN